MADQLGPQFIRLDVGLGDLPRFEAFVVEVLGVRARAAQPAATVRSSRRKATTIAWSGQPRLSRVITMVNTSAA